MKMTKKERYFSIIQQVAAQYYPQTAPKDWKNKDFEVLSNQIWESTNTLISAATLKRIFGKVYTPNDYTPQEATIDALARYCNFVEPESLEVEDAVVAVTTTAGSNRSFFSAKFGLYLAVAFVFLLSIVLYTYFQNGNKRAIASLQLVKKDGNNPVTAHFSVQIPDGKDSVFLDKGDGIKLIPIPPNSKQISCFYEYPNVYFAHLRTRKKVLSDTLVYKHLTNGWESLAYYFHQDLRERYVPMPMNLSVVGDCFHISKGLLHTMGLDTTKIIVTRLDNFKNTNVCGDDFQMSTTLQNTQYWPGVRCNTTIVQVKGSKGTIAFSLVNNGCSYWSYYQMGEITVSGQNEDIGFVSLPLNNWANIRIVNQQKRVQLFCNGKSVFNGLYQQTIGELVGVSIIFHGSGYVKNISLVHPSSPQPIFQF